LIEPNLATVSPNVASRELGQRTKIALASPSQQLRDDHDHDEVDADDDDDDFRNSLPASASDARFVPG
jgi:hypothetical protein